MKRIRTGPENGQRLARLLVAVAAMLLAAAMMELRIRPVVEEMVSYQARLYAFREINGAVMEEFEQNAVEYSELVKLSRAEDGTVTSIETDIAAVNRLKARSAGAAARQVEAISRQELKIPLGTILGGQMLSGRGPEISIRVLPAGYVSSQLYNEFTSAGINQTLHRIMLETDVQLLAVLPGYSVKTGMSTNFCIAETVIVGRIPEGYTVVGEDDNSLTAKINDYQAQP